MLVLFVLDFLRLCIERINMNNEIKIEMAEKLENINNLISSLLSKIESNIADNDIPSQYQIDSNIKLLDTILNIHNFFFPEIKLSGKDYSKLEKINKDN